MILLFAAALAGKLDDGWRGIPYGPASRLDAQPQPDCTFQPEPTVRWTCREQVGGASIVAHYMVDEGLYNGVMLDCRGFAACDELFRVVSAAWSVPFTKKAYASGVLPDGFWQLSAASTGGVVAAWSYNRFTDAATLTVIHMGLLHQIEAIQAARAAKAAEGL